MTWLLVFFGAALLIAMTPGANNLLGLHHGLAHGVRPALAGLLGRLAAFVLMIAGVVAGLAQVLAASQTAFTVLKWAGVAYLLWVGGRMLLRARRAPADEPHQAVAVATKGVRSLMRTEFLVAITNPKAVLIFTAILPQFVAPEQGPVPAQLAALGGTYLVAELLAGSLFVVIGVALRSAVASARRRRALDAATGGVLIGMAGALGATA